MYGIAEKLVALQGFSALNVFSPQNIINGKNKISCAARQPGQEGAFGLWKVQGSAHAGEKVAQRTFAHLRRYHPSFDEEKLDLDKAAKLIFEEAQSSRKSLLNTFHDLYGWLREFLLLRKVADRSLESEMLWHSVLRERRMGDLCEKVEDDLLGRMNAVSRNHTQSYLDAVNASYRACVGQTGVKVETNAALAGCAKCPWHRPAHVPGAD